MKRGFALPVFAALLTLAGCVSIHLYQKIAVVHEEYKARLASDPDLVIMREKCGISLEECPVDIFDNAYPTEDERAAIKKFGRLQEEYFDNYWSVQMDYANATNGNFAFLQRSKAQMNSLLQATVALHEGKFTWAQYGQTVAQINSDRMKEEYEKQEEARRHQEIIQTLEQENEPYPEFQRYRKESQHRHQETKHAPEPKSAPAPQPQKKAVQLEQKSAPAPQPQKKAIQLEQKSAPAPQPQKKAIQLEQENAPAPQQRGMTLKK